MGVSRRKPRNAKAGCLLQVGEACSWPQGPGSQGRAWAQERGQFRSCRVWGPESTAWAWPPQALGSCYSEHLPMPTAGIWSEGRLGQEQLQKGTGSCEPRVPPGAASRALLKRISSQPAELPKRTWNYTWTWPLSWEGGAWRRPLPWASVSPPWLPHPAGSSPNGSSRVPGTPGAAPSPDRSACEHGPWFPHLYEEGSSAE